MKSLIEKLCHRAGNVKADNPVIFVDPENRSQTDREREAEVVLIQLAHLDTKAYDWVAKHRPDVLT